MTSDKSLKREDQCWVGYKQVGMKKKGGKMVPNCVPEELQKPKDRNVGKVMKRRAPRKCLVKPTTTA